MNTDNNDNLEQKIIDTAREIFIEKGFTDTSMSEIAAKVGMNRPGIHYYFRTKDRMFQAVFGNIVLSFIPPNKRHHTEQGKANFTKNKGNCRRLLQSVQRKSLPATVHAERNQQGRISPDRCHRTTGSKTIHDPNHG